MADPRETDERLKAWLNTNQPARERMCSSVLALDRRYTRIEPRRPEGGRDGGRDAQALFEGRILTYVGVGFQNSVTDSSQDKRQAREKFSEDLTAALAQTPKPDGFVFFTNVDFTPGEIAELREIANRRGVTHSEIYWRERIRQALDMPEGLAIRYQYLSLALSEAEQAAFFARFGTQLEELLTSQHKSVAAKLDRIIFLLASSGSLRSLDLRVQLNREFKCEELGHFRILIALSRYGDNENRDTWWIGGRDSYGEHNGVRFPTFPTFYKLGSRDEQLKRPTGTAGHLVRDGVNRLSFGISFPPGAPVRFDELNERYVSIYLTENLMPMISEVSLVANQYKIVRGWAGPNFFTSQVPPVTWPEILTAEETAAPWVWGHFWADVSFSHTPPLVDRFE